MKETSTTACEQMGEEGEAKAKAESANSAEGETCQATDVAHGAGAGATEGAGARSQVNVLEVHSPHDNHLIGSLPLSSESEMLAALERAHALFLDRDHWLPPHRRIRILERLVALMEEQKDQLIATAIEEGGKPYCDTKVEVERAIQGVKLGIDAISNLRGVQVPMGLTPSSSGRLAYTVREPIGVVVSLSAFNHPINLIVHQVIPAIAAGCPVIVKPSASTPYSCLNFVKLLHEAGLPQEWCQALILNRKDAERLATDSRVGYLSFIGSAKVGWHLRSKLAPGTSVALEHGGSAPVIVDASADLDGIIQPLVKGAFYHAGQVCVSTKRIFVPASRMEEFAALMTGSVKVLKVGDPKDKDTEVGPLIRAAEVTRVAQWVKEAVEAGAKLLCGGEIISDTYYKPTILLNPPQDAKVSTDEIFGPVVCLYSYETIDQAIETANSLPFVFQAAVFAKHMDMAIHAAMRLKGTAVMVNDHTAFRVDWMPFGGRGLSGIGVGGIAHSAEEMSPHKLIVIKSSSLD